MSERFENVWDAIEDDPEKRALMQVRCNLLNLLRLRKKQRQPRALGTMLTDERQMVVYLEHADFFVFDCDLCQGLRGAEVEDLAEVEISPSGFGLSWPRLDVDLWLPALMDGIYGGIRWMERLKMTSDDLYAERMVRRRR